MTEISGKATPFPHMLVPVDGVARSEINTSARSDGPPVFAGFNMSVLRRSRTLYLCGRVRNPRSYR